MAGIIFIGMGGVWCTCGVVEFGLGVASIALAGAGRATCPSDAVTTAGLAVGVLSIAGAIWSQVVFYVSVCECLGELARPAHAPAERILPAAPCAGAELSAQELRVSPTPRNRFIASVWVAVTLARLAVLVWASTILLQSGWAHRDDPSWCAASTARTLGNVLIAQWVVAVCAMSQQCMCMGGLVVGTLMPESPPAPAAVDTAVSVVPRDDAAERTSSYRLQDGDVDHNVGERNGQPL